MTGKPDGEDLLPTFMQSTMDFFKALAVFLGLPAITACLLMRHYHAGYAHFPLWYMSVIESVFKRQNALYLIQIVPAAAVRYFFEKRLKVGEALVVAASLFVVAVLSVYPGRALLNPQTLKNIVYFIMTPPLLTAFFILRINRLSVSGSLVILFFVVMLCAGFFM